MEKTRWELIQSYIRPPYGWVLSLSLLSGISYILALFERSPVTINQIPQGDLIPWYRGLTVTLLGSYIVAVLIDRTYREIEENERMRMKNLALEQLTGPINRQLTLLGNWYVASLSDQPGTHPDSYRTLLEGDYYETVRWLDFSKEYSTAGSQRISWFDISARYFQESQEGIESAISKYGPFMDPEMMSDFQQLSSSTLTGIMKSFGSTDVVRVDIQNGVQRDYTMLVGTNMDEITEEHIDALLNVLTYFEAPGTPNLTSIDEAAIWREDMYPDVGDARSEIHPDDANPKYGAGPGAPPEGGP